MNRQFIISFSFLPIIVLAGLAVLVLTGRDSGARADGVEKDLQLYLEIREKLLDHFDGEIDEIELRNRALQGLAAATGDSYTRVNPPIAARRQERDLEGEFFGIGVIVGENEDGSLRITEVTDGGGASKAGILANDVIVAVDGKSILGMSMSDSRELIRSEVQGSAVLIGLLRGGDSDSGTDPAATRLDVEVIRERIETFSVHDAHIMRHDNRRFGYVRMSDFTSTTARQFEQAVRELQADGAQGLILDLRGNGGGRVTAAVDVIDLLLPQKDALVMFTRSTREQNRSRDREYRTSSDSAVTNLPLVVLVDDTTASAAELVAGALRDHGRALVVGSRTYGKGVVQTIFRLDSDPDYSLNVTTTQYFTPLRRAVQGDADGSPGGIQPDIQVLYKEGEGERARVHARLRVRQARYNREQLAETSNWWDYEDRVINAAVKVLAGVPVVLE
jgi:carboxyl-terminal processing protease